MLQLATNIRLIRQLSGQSQQAFGRKFGVTKAMIVSYEGGKAKPNNLFIQRLAKAAGLPEADLLDSELREAAVNKQVLKAFLKGEKLEVQQTPILNDSQPHYGTLPDYREKYIQSLERENSRLRADLEAIREKVLISLKGLSESERLILAMLKASLQLDVEREAKGDRKKLKDLQYKVSSQIDTNYAGHEAAGSRKGDKVEELP